jgi:hypothetical protein
MRTFLIWGVVFAAAAQGASSRPADNAPPAPAARPVLVELFTAQGCSSCPPADRLLTRLGGENAGIIPLAFHVDIWNHGGWTDPFSSADWTKRQVAYARKLGLTQIYTPQAVVDGSKELVGSLEPDLRAAVSAAASKPAASIALSLEPSESRVKVRTEVELPGALAGRDWELMLAVYETGLVTPVARGENGGRTLNDDYVVRSLAPGGRVRGKTTLTATLPLEKEWKRERLGVAAFLQDPASLEIRGASARALTAP